MLFICELVLFKVITYMTERNRTASGRLIALILRHKPEMIGIKLDEHGWADVDKLLEGVNRNHSLTREQLEEIVRTDNKQRFPFNEDKTKIRANQGHSISVDVELQEAEPPEFLYHGTGEKFVSSIKETDILPCNRLYVHLSSDIDTAIKVGSRHGKPFVFTVSSGQMYRDGYKFFRSVNGVWLTKKVEAKYLTR